MQDCEFSIREEVSDENKVVGAGELVSQVLLTHFTLLKPYGIDLFFEGVALRKGLRLQGLRVLGKG